MTERKILVTEPFREKHMKRFQEAAGEAFSIEQIARIGGEEFKEKLKEVEIVVGQPAMSMIQDPEENCPNLKLIQICWAGTDMYTRSILPFPKEYMKLANCSGAYGMIMSQFVIGMILSVMLNFKAYHEQQEKQVWERRGPVKSLEGARVLIYGAGDIGTAIAKRLTGFDAYTIGVCRDLTKKRPYYNEVCTLKEAENHLPSVDVVIGCIPNSEESCGYFSKGRLSLIKEGGVIVNVGRGNFIDCMALNELLNKGRLWGAALDVTDPEPLPTGHPLWNNPRCMITPHASGASFASLEETEDLICDIICENLQRYSRGEEINNRIY